MSTYAQKKEAARLEAIDWMNVSAQEEMSYEEIAEAGQHFYKKGKRYGLLREFRENAIPC